MILKFKKYIKHSSSFRIERRHLETWIHHSIKLKDVTFELKDHEWMVRVGTFKFIFFFNLTSSLSQYLSLWFLIWFKSSHFFIKVITLQCVICSWRKHKQLQIKKHKHSHTQPFSNKKRHSSATPSSASVYTITLTSETKWNERRKIIINSSTQRHHQQQ